MRKFAGHAALCLALIACCMAQQANGASPARGAREAVRPVDVPKGTDPRQAVLGDIDFREIPVQQAARLASELTRQNVVATAAAAQARVTLYLRNATLQALIENLCRVSGLWYRYDKATRTYVLMTADEFRRDVVVYRSDVTRVFTMKYYNVVSAATTLQSLYGRRVQVSASVEEPLGISALGSPLSGRRTGGGSGGASPGPAALASAAALTAPAPSPSGPPGGADSRSAGLDRLSSGRAATIGDINEGEVSRISKTDLEALDQQREPPLFVTYNRLHNLLIVRSSDERLVEEVAALIDSIDRPARQVLLEVEVLKLLTGDTFSSAFDLDFHNGQVGIRTSSGSSAAGPGVFNVLSAHIRARLELLQTEKRVRVLSTPVLMASNNQPSRLFIGTEQVLVTGVTSNTTTNSTASNTSFSVNTERRDIGNQLIIVPRINDDRTVTLSLDQDTSTVNRGGALIPVVSGNSVMRFPVDTVETANMQATVLAGDGYTAAVGGLISERADKAEQKVPLLGDIPLLGVFFRKVSDEQSRSEIVLLITPHILDSAAGTQDASRAYLDRHGVRPPDAVRAAITAAPASASMQGNDR